MPTQAMVAIEPSLDWLVVSCPDIGIAEVTDPGDGAQFRWVGVRIIEPLRGSPPKVARYILQTAGFDRDQPDSNFELPPELGDEFLLFFDKDGLVERAIDLKNPTSRILSLAIGMDFGIYDSRRQILDCVHRRMSRESPDSIDVLEPRSFLFQVPEDTPFGQLGTPVYLIVPADPELRAAIVAETTSPEISIRAQAAFRLGSYPGDDTVELLMGLLKDPGAIVMRGSDKQGDFEVTVFPVRQAAYFALQELGVVTAKPEGYSDRLQRHDFGH